ncbi:hypothetical protein OC835_007474, partial [Tilletia horrida]
PLDPIFARLTVDTTGYEAPLVQELRLVQSMLLSWGEALEREASAAFVEEEQEEGVPGHDHHSDETRPPLPSASSPAVGSTRRREASPPSPSEQSPTKRGKHRQAADEWPDISERQWADAQMLRTSSPVVPSQPERAQGPPTERQSKLDFAISDSIGFGWNDIDLLPSRKVIKRIANGDFVPLWLLSPEACRQAQSQEPGFKKAPLPTSGGGFVDVDELKPDGFVSETDMDYETWSWCLGQLVKIMREQGVAEATWRMFEQTHSKLRELAPACGHPRAVQKWFYKSRRAWCTQVQDIREGLSTGPLRNLALVTSKDLEAPVAEERQADHAARLQARVAGQMEQFRAEFDRLRAAVPATSPSRHDHHERGRGAPSSSPSRPARDKGKQAARFQPFSPPTACACCGGRAAHNVAQCNRTHFAKPSLTAYETASTRERAGGPLIFKSDKQQVCIAFNSNRHCTNRSCQGHRCSLCDSAEHGAQACRRAE